MDCSPFRQKETGTLNVKRFHSGPRFVLPTKRWSCHGNSLKWEDWLGCGGVHKEDSYPLMNRESPHSRGWTVPGPLRAEALAVSGKRAGGKGRPPPPASRGCCHPSGAELIFSQLEPWKWSLPSSVPKWESRRVWVWSWLGLAFSPSRLLCLQFSRLPGCLLTEPSPCPAGGLCALPFLVALISTFPFFYLRRMSHRQNLREVYFSSRTTVSDLIKIISTFKSKIYHWYISVDIYHLCFQLGPFVSYHLA